MIDLLVCRHGQTDYNLQSRYAGSSDILLNENGRQQAELLAADPEVAGVDVIVASPLLRAVQTALAIQRETENPLHIIRAFSERNFGVYEGLTRDEVQRIYPDLWAQNMLHQADKAPSGGETLVQFTQRIKPGLEQLMDAYDGKTVLLVAHGFVSREINRILCGLSYENMHGFVLQNAHIARYKLERSVFGD